MQPDDTGLIQILSANPMQYVIPRFQRDYTWGKNKGLPQVNQLWKDIIDAHDNQCPHFTGTIVFTNDNCGNDVCNCKYLIDGQQRLITTSLMIRAFYNHLDVKQKKEVIQTYLNNVVESIYGYKLKILPGENDRKAYKAIITSKSNIDEKYLETPVGKTYSFFDKVVYP